MKISKKEKRSKHYLLTKLPAAQICHTIERSLGRRSIEPVINGGVKYTYSSVIEVEDEDGEEIIK